MRGRQEPFGAADEQWLAAATEVSLARQAGTDAKEHLQDAMSIANELLGPDRVSNYVRREWNGALSDVDALILLADSVHRSGALRLAACLMDDLAECARLDQLSRGRLLYLRARLAWKLGDLEEAKERYALIGALGREAGSRELQALEHVGLSTVAQLRGNFPEVRRHAEQAAALTANWPALARLAQQGLMLSAVKRKDFDTAVVEAWAALQLVQGDDEWEAEALIDLGMVMLEADHPAEAKAAFAAVLDRVAPVRLILPALGGLALSSARIGAEATIEWAMREIWRSRTLGYASYEVAEAHLECAIALSMLGRDSDAARFREIAEQVAGSRGFHELEFRAAGITRRAEAGGTGFVGEAAKVARELAAMEPQLPDRITFEDARA